MACRGFLVSYTTLAHPGARLASPARLPRVARYPLGHRGTLREYGTLICSFLVPPLDARDTQSTYSTRASQICLRAAGSFKRYANEPRLQLVVLRKLAESGRVVATRGVATRLFAPRRRLQAMGSRALPDVLFWKILEFWRTDRDP